MLDKVDLDLMVFRALHKVASLLQMNKLGKTIDENADSGIL
jgi:hypothetical protein